jgi:general secretion pathway protein E
MSLTRLDLEYVVGILRKRGLISARQEKIIYKKAPVQEEKLAQICRVKRGGFSAQSCDAEITPVDVLASMKLEPGEGTDGRLDEEAIMRAVAAELGMAFKKIDPLELDLELVSTPGGKFPGDHYRGGL